MPRAARGASASERERVLGRRNTLGTSRWSLPGPESFAKNSILILVLQWFSNRMEEERVSDLKIDQWKVSNLKNGEK